MKKEIEPEKTFSKSATDFINTNATTKRCASLASFAVNMAVQEIMGVVEQHFIDECPHKEVCGGKHRMAGCSAKYCRYIERHMNAIKSYDCLCYSKKDE